MSAIRSDDMIILRGVDVFPMQIEEIVLRTPGLAPHFQIVLSKKDRLDRMTVRVDPEVNGRNIYSRTSATNAPFAAIICS